MRPQTHKPGSHSDTLNPAAPRSAGNGLFVVFTITLALLLLALDKARSEPNENDGFVSIFDGESLRGWKAHDLSYWSVQDEAITGRITPEHPCTVNQYLVWQGGELRDFELKLKFRMTTPPGGTRQGVNGGFQFRSQLLPDHDVAGYQVDNDYGGDWKVRLYDEHGRHTLAWRGQRAVFDAVGKMTHTPIEGEAGQPARFNLDEWHEYHLKERS